MQEADTTTEWNVDVIQSFLSLRPLLVQAPALSERKVEAALAVTDAIAPAAADENHTIEISVGVFVSELTASDLVAIEAYWENQRGVPADFDRKLLPVCRQKVGRDLERPEIQLMRREFQKAVKVRLLEGSGSGEIKKPPV